MKEVRLDISDEVQKSIKEIEELHKQRLKDYNLVHSLHKKGMGTKEIAKTLNYSPSVIYNWIYGSIKPVKTFPKELVRKLKLDLGLSAKEISSLLGIKPISVYHHTRQKPREKITIKLSDNTLEFIRNEDITAGFLKYFWKDKISQKELQDFENYCKFLKLEKSLSAKEIAKKLKKSISTIHDWKRNRRLPVLARFLELYLQIGKPENGKIWLSLNLGQKGVFLTKPLQVPTKIIDWKDIENALNQLEAKEDILSHMSKRECFGFLLGVYVGDACKFTKNKDCVGLILSKKYSTNKNLGNFFCQCIQKLGLNASRKKDHQNKFKWRSQESPFFSWIYKTVLGLDENETTTYNPIKANWLLDAHLEVVKRFLQGVYESDGCVTYEGVVSCAVYPNNELIQKLLKRFAIHSVIDRKGKWRDLIIYGKSFKKCSDILFAEEIKSEKYKKLKMIVNAQRLKPGEKYPPEIINILKRMIQKKLKNYQISKTMLINYNLFIPKTTVQYYRNIFNLNIKNTNEEKIKGG